AKNVLARPANPVAGNSGIPVPDRRGTRVRDCRFSIDVVSSSYPQSAIGQPKINVRSAIWPVPGAPGQMLTCARVISAAVAGWQSRQAKPDGPDCSSPRRWTDPIKAVLSGGIRARHEGV